MHEQSTHPGVPHRPRIALLALCLGFVLALAGCSSGGGGGSSTAVGALPQPSVDCNGSSCIE